ncbi:MAG: AMP-binding protein [Polyangiaceae bacterium]
MTKLDVQGLMGCGLTEADAEALEPRLSAAMSTGDPLASWRAVSKDVLRPSHPEELHRFAHRVVFADWEASRGPAPLWAPSEEEVAATNLGRAGARDWAAFHRSSVKDPEAFWPAMLARLGVVFEDAPERMVDVSDGVEAARWLPGAKLNIAGVALAGPDDRTAVVVAGEGKPLARHTLGEVRDGAMRVAAALDGLGYRPGDAIAIDMPMTYPSVLIYLGIVAMGGAVVSIADSFAPAEIATRLRIANAKAIFTQDLILRREKRLPLYTRVTEADAPRAIVLSAGEQLAVELRDGDLRWGDFVAAGDGRDHDLFVAESDATTNVLFSSGTTGEPKAIPWSHVTPIKAASDGWAHHDIREGDVVAWPTNLGWMMGPWLIYASLLNGATIGLYEGSPLDRGFGQFVQDAEVTMLGVVPSLVKTWRATGCMAGLDWSTIRCFSSTGEASTPDEMWWLVALAGYKPVIEYCGGTEIGGGYITGTMVQPQVASAFSTPAIGCDLVILDEEGQPAEEGELALVPPMIGSSARLLNREHGAVYFAGMPKGPNGEVLRRHGDQMRRLAGGYFRAQGRVDDTMNLGGIKTSSAEIERACNAVDGVVETAAIAVEPPDGGPSELVVYAVLKLGTTVPDDLRRRLQQAIRSDLNPLFKVSDVRLVDALPRTASGKVMRRILRKRHAAGD